MKRLFLFTALLGACLLLGVMGCDDDGNGSSDPLVGTWKAQSFNGQPLGNDIAMRITFKKDGTFSATTTIQGSADSYSGVWSTSNGTLTTVSEGKTESTPYSVNGKTLTLGGSGEVFVLTR